MALCKASSELPNLKRMKSLNQRLLTSQILESCFRVYKILQFLSPLFPTHLILFFCNQYELFPNTSTVSSLSVFAISLIFIIVKNFIIKITTSVVEVPMLQQNVSQAPT